MRGTEKIAYKPPPDNEFRTPGLMMFQSGRDWWRQGRIGPAWWPGWILVWADPMEEIVDWSIYSEGVFIDPLDYPPAAGDMPDQYTYEVFTDPMEAD